MTFNYKNYLRFIKRSLHLFRIKSNLAFSKLLTAAYLLPGFIQEPFFIRLFGTQDWVDSNQPADMFKHSIDIRSKTIKDFLLKPYHIDVAESRVIEIFNLIDKAFKLTGVMFEPVSIDEAMNDLPTSTSAGYPTGGKKGALKEYIKSVYHEMYLRGNYEQFLSKMLVYIAWRTQPRLSGIKYRQIFVVAYIILGIEARFGKPFKDHFKKTTLTPYVLNDVFPDLVLRLKILKEAFSKICSLDYSTFDQSLANKLIYFFFLWLRTHLILDDSDSKLFQAIIHFHLSASIITADRSGPVMVRKLRGLLSGSYFTNFMGTFCNLFMLLDFNITNQIEIPSEFLNVKGDDSMLPLTYTNFIKDFSKFVLDNYGMVISINKSKLFNVHDKINFLGCDFDVYGRYLNWDLAKRQLSISERFIPESQMTPFERHHSKICSICFKFSDGYKFYDEFSPYIFEEFGKQEIPKFYTEIFSLTGNDIGAQRRFADYKYNGYLHQ